MCCQPFPVQRAEQLLGSGDAVRSRSDHGDVHGIHGFAQGRVRPVAEARGADLTQSLFVGSGHADSRSTTVSASASVIDRKSTRLNSSHANISYAVFCLKKM